MAAAAARRATSLRMPAGVPEIGELEEGLEDIGIHGVV